jgi:pimeloyl-ACP methyl ester carboxylesterase
MMIRHGRTSLALHELRSGSSGRPLLHLHGLGERTPASVPSQYSAWPGPVYGLDFTGHGESSVPKGGGYTCEMLMADVDAALAELGETTLVGRGLGAYVAVLVAGGRPGLVRGAVLRDGPGLTGGGVMPGSPSVEYVDPATVAAAPPDPWALVELTRDPRPPDYATSFVRQAVHFSGLAEPITVCTIGRPAWLDAVVAEPGVRVTASVEEALRSYAGA